jgi:Tfp pilus assembly protein PilV
VGLLGISALQLTSLKNSFSAVQRGDAAYLIAGMTDNMRANALGVENGLYDTDVLAAAGMPQSGNKTTPQAIAQYDYNVWQQSIERTFAFDDPLDKPEGRIDCPTTYNCIVEINWVDTRSDSSLQDSSGKRYKHLASVVF